MKPSFTAGVLYMLLSATGLAFTGFFGQVILESMALPALIFWRFSLSFFLCWGMLALLGKLKGALKFTNFKMHLLRAFFVLTSQYSFYYYIEHNELFNAIVLLNTGPLFIPLIEWVFLGQKGGKSTWISVIVSFLGMLLILHPTSGIISLISLVGLLAGVCQGASQVVFGINSKAERTDISVLYLFLICATFSAIPYLFTHTTWIVNAHPHWIYFTLPLLAIASICNQLARAEAYQHSTPGRLSSFLYFSILLAGLLGWIVYNQVPSTLSILGAALVILGGVLKIVLRHHAIKNRAN